MQWFNRGLIAWLFVATTVAVGQNKVTDLPAIVTPADPNDLLYIIDVSDTTDDPAGSSKSIRIDELGGGASALNDLTDVTITTPSADQVLKYDGAGWINAASPGGGGAHVIESITLTTAGEFDFDNIPQGYRRLIIKGHLNSDVNADSDSVEMYFNADTTAANYFSQRLLVQGTSTSIDEEATGRVGSIAGSGANVVGDSQFEATLEGYATDREKTAIAKNNTYYSVGARLDIVHTAMAHDSMTDAITRIRIRTDNHSTDQLTGTLTLYGEY